MTFSSEFSLDRSDSGFSERVPAGLEGNAGTDP